MTDEEVEDAIVKSLTVPRPRVYHRAKHIGPNGEVSALCYKKPHAIDMSKRQTWTLSDEAVTCARCLKLIKARNAKAGGEASP